MKHRTIFSLCWLLGLSCAALGAGQAAAQSPPAESGQITGLGGVFFKSPDPKALSKWYRDVLGLKIESWGGAVMHYDAPGHPAVLVWNPFKESSEQMAPSKREFMLNFAVDDMDAFLSKIEAKGVVVLKRDDSDPSGSFAWILDPDGTKIEFWQPKKK